MRKIKFRGKAIRDYPDYKIKKGDWIYGYFVSAFNECGIAIESGVNFIFGDQPVIKVDPKTVGQYANSEDKKDKEIYEGDICRIWYPDGYKIGVVEFEATCFYWNSNTVGFWGIELEIIGNIYDNPELLKEV